MASVLIYCLVFLLMVTSAAYSKILNAVDAEPTEEFRGLFLTTVGNTDWPTSRRQTSVQQQKDLIGYLDMMKDSHINAVMFQARTSGDAVYNSSIEPWSRFLTGKQGTPPTPFWDPLEMLVNEAHKRGIQVHAWLNPYIANQSPNWKGLAANHMAMRYRQYAYPYGSHLWMDPGADVIVDQLQSVVKDIITRYKVDGIHFDDYFYPYPEKGTPFPDNATYQKYIEANGTLPRDDWRRQNVNKMVHSVFTMIKSRRPEVTFSISPFGLYKPGERGGMPPPIKGLDPYSELYADTLLWLQNGWVDFLAPQLYWSINSTHQSYPMLLDWWLAHNTDKRNIYVANGVYRIVEQGDWPVSEIVNQVVISRDLTRRQRRSLGNIMFSAKYFRDNTKGIRDTFQHQVYTVSATVPPIP